MGKHDIPWDELDKTASPFEGEYTVSHSRGEVFVEDVNGVTVCSFNRYTQLPLTDSNMEWEFNFWLDRAHQICNMLNFAWEKMGSEE